MLALSAPDLIIFAAAAAVVVFFIFMGFIKGLVRMTFTLAALAAGGVAAYWGFHKGGGIAATLVSSPEPWMSAAVGVILGLAVFFLARALFGVLLRPIKMKDGKVRNLGFLGGVVGFVAGAACAWFMLSGIRYVGTLAELDWIKTSTADGKVTETSEPPLAKLKRLVDDSVLGKLQEQYDLFNDRARANLAKLTLLVGNKVAITTAAATDKPVRDAILQEDIRKMLENQSADLQSFIDDRQYSHLLQSKPIKDAAKTPAARSALKALDIEKSLGLTKKPIEAEKKSD